jgi:hypothetical protein
LSVAVFANPSLFRYSFAQDWTDWHSGTFTPVIMSYTPDITLFINYMNFAISHHAGALMGIGLLWPDMQETAKWQAAAVRNAHGAGVCFFDFANVDSQLDLAAWQYGTPEQDFIDVDSTRYEPVSPVFDNLPHSDMVKDGYGLTSWGSDLRFAAFLLSLSLDPGRDLARMDLDRDRFLHFITQDVTAFEYLDHKVFPIGDRLIEPPQRRIRYTFIPWSEGDSLAIVESADAVSDLANDTILYPRTDDPLTTAAFNARPHCRETLLAPAGIYIFKVDSIYPEGRIARRKDLLPDFVPVFVNWTIKKKAALILSRFE